MSNAWVHTLTQIEPDYLKLSKILEMGPRIHADLIQRGREWCIVLQEEPTGSDFVVDLGNFDLRVEWTVNQLKEWPDVRRMAFDMWYFKRKRDALKFQTFYNLVWAGQ